jgi:SAM-dependent methyltransferase
MDLSEKTDRAYAELAQYADALGVPDGFKQIGIDYSTNRRWRFDKELIDLVPGGAAGKRVLDFGCKWGHSAPLFFALGASHVGLVDVVAEYVETGRRVIGSAFEGRTCFELLDGCYLPFAPDSVDLIFVNEVISHVNPAFLDTFYAEVARVLAPGGHMILSDGNNWANPGVRAALPDLWDAWENGPSGRKTDRDVVTVSFLERRREVARNARPDLGPDAVDRFARNTSGMFGETLLKALQEFADKNILVERPYRYGTVSNNPSSNGSVMERPFHPDDVVRALELHALQAKQVFRPLPPDNRIAALRLLSAVRNFGKFGLQFRPKRGVGDEPMFLILAVKP